MSTSPHQGTLAGTRWDPSQYAKFADYRLRPALELLDRIPPASPGIVYDLGCGSGNVTRIIAERWPAAKVYGLDNSPEMLAQAARDGGAVQWIEADVRTWSPSEAPDLLFSNATLQWVDEHRKLFPRLIGMLKPGGCLAVQMPLSWAAPSHRLMRETLANGNAGTPFGAAALRRGVGRDWVEQSAVYYDLLADRAQHIDIWETEYMQALEGDDPVLEWVKGTGLRPILNALDDDGERAAFLAQYAERLRAAYPKRADGRTLYPFRRLFIVAVI